MRKMKWRKRKCRNFLVLTLCTLEVMLVIVVVVVVVVMVFVVNVERILKGKEGAVLFTIYTVLAIYIHVPDISGKN